MFETTNQIMYWYFCVISSPLVLVKKNEFFDRQKATNDSGVHPNDPDDPLASAYKNIENSWVSLAMTDPAGAGIWLRLHWEGIY